MINNLIIAVYVSIALYAGIQALRDGIPKHKRQIAFTVTYLIGISIGMLLWPLAGMYVSYMRNKDK